MRACRNASKQTGSPKLCHAAVRQAHSLCTVLNSSALSPRPVQRNMLLLLLLHLHRITESPRSSRARHETACCNVSSGSHSSNEHVHSRHPVPARAQYSAAVRRVPAVQCKAYEYATYIGISGQTCRRAMSFHKRTANAFFSAHTNTICDTSDSTAQTLCRGHLCAHCSTPHKLWHQHSTQTLRNHWRHQTNR
jgi:hypothetical protein